MNSRYWTNPLNFRRDLDSNVLHDLEIFTLMARKRLEERDINISELKKSWLEGKSVPKPPLMIPDYPPRLINAEMYDYFVNTVTHYKSYCAFLARFGQDNVAMYTITWEYELLKQLGGELSQIRHKAPETITYPIQGPEDMDHLPQLNFDALVSTDAALVRFTHEQLGDLIDPGIYVSLDPFSQVCSLLRKPETLMMDIMDDPSLVHRMCQYMTDIQTEILRRILEVAPLMIFSPGYTLMLSPAQFKEFALPYVEQLVNQFPGVPWMMGSGGNATHLIKPLMMSKVPIPFIDASSDLTSTVELSKEYKKPTTVLFPRSVLMHGNRDEIRNTTRKLLLTVKEIPFLYWTEAILGGDVPNPTIDLFIEAYRDYASYPLDKQLEQPEPFSNKHEKEEKVVLRVEDLVWDKDGEAAFNASVPFMFRKQAKRQLEKMVAVKGIRNITAEVFEQAKKEAGF